MLRPSLRTLSSLVVCVLTAVAVGACGAEPKFGGFTKDEAERAVLDGYGTNGRCPRPSRVECRAVPGGSRGSWDCTATHDDGSREIEGVHDAQPEIVVVC